MIATQNQLEKFQEKLQDKLSPIANFPDALDTLIRAKEKAMSDFKATESDVAELMEMHFGQCVEIDDAIIELFPEQFKNR